MEYTLITGPTSGIGFELVKLFAKDRNNLVLVARSEDKLEKIRTFFMDKYGIDIVMVCKDLSRPEAAKEVYDEVKERGITVTNLVNNAGIGTYGLFHEISTDESLDLLTLNIRTLTHMTRLFLPDMVARGKGRVMNVASTAAFQPGPLMATYYASKAYVLHLSEALSEELEGKGVTVTALCPGATTTDFQRKAKVSKSNIANFNLMDAKTVAESGYRAFLEGRSLDIPGARNKVSSFLVRFVPRKTIAKVVRKLNK